MNVESAMWTSGYLFDYQKQKKYTFVQEKYPIKQFFCYYGRIVQVVFGATPFKRI